MEKKKRRFIILVCFLILLAALILSPVFPYVRSLAVMSFYSPYCAKNSIMKSQSFELKIPSGDGWYPFVMTYEADEAFSSYIGIPDTKLTILYNFPAFSPKNGCSGLFDESSPYYSSFYGAYLVRRADGQPYGISPDMKAPDEKSVSDIAKFDLFTLAMGDLGLTSDKQVFKYLTASEQADQSFLGYDGWTKLSSDLTCNGMNHNSKGFASSYLQYGSPNFPVSSDFAPIEMKSAVYAKYFPEWGTTVYFYVMSPSQEVCEDCVLTILSKSTLKSG